MSEFHKNLILRQVINNYVNTVRQNAQNVATTTNALINVYNTMKPYGLGNNSVVQAFNTLTPVFQQYQIGVYNYVMNQIKNPQMLGLSGIKPDYTPNPNLDRDSQNVQIKMASVVNSPNSKASYKPGMSNFEDLFGNSVTSPEEYSYARFTMPGVNNMKSSYKNKFETFQA
jgi:hypothetical protein